MGTNNGNIMANEVKTPIQNYFEKNQRCVDTNITVVSLSYKATPIKDHSSYQASSHLL
jgi:hypothetical protein